MPKPVPAEDRRALKPYGLLLLALSAQVGAMIFGKQAAVSMEAFSLDRILHNPLYLASLTCLGIQAMVWPSVLKHFPLFVAYIYMSLIYPMIAALSRLVFHESLSPMNIVGALTIMGGVIAFVSGRSKDGSNV